MKKQILPKKWNIDHLQDPPHLETKNGFKNTELMEIEMDSMSTIQKPGQLKKKTQAPIDQAGRVHTNTKVNSERPGGTFKLPQPNFMQSPQHKKQSSMGMN